jgi:phosphoribosylaminoimidazolecarboxamide formyltransferase / IMP cyclohydrolase
LSAMGKVARALVSVSDKTGLAGFARGLARLGVALISTGGTAKALREAGLAVTDVSAVTGFPEMLDGRVKTLHPKVHGGILARWDDPAHAEQAALHGIERIDLVVVNLYPFEATVRRPGVTRAEAIEQIDIGGPAMVRSAAKNHAHAGVVVDPADYGGVLAELGHSGALSDATRARLAQKAFAHTARYDALIAEYLAGEGAAPAAPGTWPDAFTIRLARLQGLRYGENPHQTGAFYRCEGEPPYGLGAASQLQGKELSFNNLVDLQAAFECALEFPETAAVIIKHTNPCGAAVDASQAEAYRRARAGDPVSAYGGVLGFNRPLEGETAREIAGTFVEAVAAPDYTAEALAVLRDRKNLRLLRVPPPPDPRAPYREFRRVRSGLLVQDSDAADLDEGALRVVSRRPPTAAEMAALRFAWRVAKHVKSNAIVLTRERETVGIGAGQMSRVDSVRLAVMKAQSPTAGTVLASDAFFPFRDGLDAAAAAGVTAVIQPGGSVRDAEVIAAADEHGMAMVTTGIRHFRH